MTSRLNVDNIEDNVKKTYNVDKSIKQLTAKSFFNVDISNRKIPNYKNKSFMTLKVNPLTNQPPILIKRSNSSNLLLSPNQIKEEFNEFYNEVVVFNTFSNSYESNKQINSILQKNDLIFDYFNGSNDKILIEPKHKVNTNTEEQEKMYTIQEESIIINKSKREYELKYIDIGQSLRKSYLDKLKNRNVWTDDKPKSHNSLIIFDWDDTLLCSSYLTPYGIFKDDMIISEKDLNKLAFLDEIVYKILSFAIENSSTYIITNAAPGWVEYSSQRFYPKSKEILKKVVIVSARGKYEKKYPGDSKQWKVQAFLETCKNFNLNLVTNLICLGDSVIEMEAAHILASKFSKAFIKTVKFKEAPKPEELIKQLSTVLDQLSTIFSTVKNLTIRVERKKKSK